MKCKFDALGNYSFFENSLYLRLFEHRKRTVTLYQNYGSSLVEATGLEPAVSWSQTRRDTKLRYASVLTFSALGHLL